MKIKKIQLMTGFFSIFALSGTIISLTQKYGLNNPKNLNNIDKTVILTPHYDMKVNPIIDWANFLQGGAALKIINKSIQRASYWYTSAWLKPAGTEDRWYPHNIDQGCSTWDWTWSNYSTDNPMEIFINGLGNYNYFILLGFLQDNLTNHYLSFNIAKYPKNPSSGLRNPSFTSPIWYSFNFNSPRWMDGSTHSKLTIDNFSNNWLTINNMIIKFV
ncbi:MAG: hypothetical protein ACRDCG_02750 [Mycoplasmoidaceae bacterium]